MTETARRDETATPDPPEDGPLLRRGPWLRIASAVACGLVGFLLVAQFHANEQLGQRLDIEREQDLAQLLSDLTTQGDRLQAEITDLRLTLLAFETSAERDELARASLRRRLQDLRILAGTAEATGLGLRLTVGDPNEAVTQELLVDVVQELRDGGAEAIAVNGTRLVASSAFSTRNGRLLLEGSPLQTPYTIVVVGPSDTIAKALSIPGGAIDSVEALPQVSATVEQLAEVTVPARGEPQPFVYGEPLQPEGDEER
ncbi:MAG: DUF881 domain-containing protein [Egibacteraceae bacterium]